MVVAHTAENIRLTPETACLNPFIFRKKTLMYVNYLKDARNGPFKKLVQLSFFLNASRAKCKARSSDFAWSTQPKNVWERKKGRRRRRCRRRRTEVSLFVKGAHRRTSLERSHFCNCNCYYCTVRISTTALLLLLLFQKRLKQVFCELCFIVATQERKRERENVSKLTMTISTEK